MKDITKSITKARKLTKTIETVEKKTKKVGKVRTLDHKKFSVFGNVETDKKIIKGSMDDECSDLTAELRSWEKIKVASTRKSSITGQTEDSRLDAIFADEWCFIACGKEQLEDQHKKGIHIT